MDKNIKIVKLALVSARERLESGHNLFGIGNFPDSISRAYYGVLDAARAALILKGETPKTHAGVIIKFNQKFIKTGLIDERFGQLLSRMEKVRTEADYQFGVKFTKKEAERVLKEAEEFVFEVKKIL